MVTSDWKGWQIRPSDAFALAQRNSCQLGADALKAAHLQALRVDYMDGMIATIIVLTIGLGESQANLERKKKAVLWQIRRCELIHTFHRKPVVCEYVMKIVFSLPFKLQLFAFRALRRYVAQTMGTPFVLINFALVLSRPYLKNSRIETSICPWEGILLSSTFVS